MKDRRLVFSVFRRSAILPEVRGKAESDQDGDLDRWGNEGGMEGVCATNLKGKVRPVKGFTFEAVCVQCGKGFLGL